MYQLDVTKSVICQLAEATGAKRTIFSWALRETAPWRDASISRERLERQVTRFENNLLPAFVFRISDGKVIVTDKSNLTKDPAVKGLQRRADQYRVLFQDAVERLWPSIDTTFCVYVGDRLANPKPFPVFAFQKELGCNELLLPDIDFLVNDYYQDTYFEDTRSYYDKEVRAYFIGAITGGIVTSESVRSLSLPRLAAATHFHQSSHVDFRLVPNGLFDSTVTADLAARLPFCTTRTADWNEQRANRLLISMDGNGATCSRVVVALRSNSTLLKYHSNHALYYFDSLRPWVHYVPIERHVDVEAAVRRECATPGIFAGIGEQGRDFAYTYLAKENVLFYVAALLALYEDCLSP